MFIRESINHGKSYLSIAQEIKDADGNWKVQVVAGLGYLEDLEKVYKDPKKFFNGLLEKLNMNKRSLIDKKEKVPKKDQNTLKNVGYLYIKAILLQLHIDEFFKNKQKQLNISYDLFKIYSMLVYSQILHPCSFEESFFRACEFFDTVDYELWDVYRALSYFADYVPELQSFIYKQLGIPDDKLMTLYFDGSNVYFETDKEDPDIVDEEGNIIQEGLRTHGFSKENRPLPIVNFGLIATDQGLPLAFNLFRGKGHEKSHLVPLIDYLRKDYQLDNFKLVADRGLYSGKVIRAIENYDRGDSKKSEEYIIGLPIRSGSTDLKNWALDDRNFSYMLVQKKKNDFSVFKYKYRRIKQLIHYEIGGKKKKYRSKQAQLLYYSPRYSRKEKYKRIKIKEQAKNLIESPGKYTAKTNTGAAGFVSELHFNEKTGEIATKRKLSLDEEKIKKQESLDGFYVIVTNDLKLMPLQIRRLYRKLSIVEDDFRILKSFLKIRPVYVRTPKHILAHIQILIISLQILRILQTLLGNRFTIPQIGKALKNYNAVHVEDDCYMILYQEPIIEQLQDITEIGITYRYETEKQIKKIFSKRNISDVCKKLLINYS